MPAVITAALACRIASRRAFLNDASHCQRRQDAVERQLGWWLSGGRAALHLGDYGGSRSVACDGEL